MTRLGGSSVNYQKMLRPLFFSAVGTKNTYTVYKWPGKSEIVLGKRFALHAHGRRQLFWKGGGGGQDRARGAPFDSHEYVIRFRPIQPVCVCVGGGGGVGCCPLSADSTSGGGGAGCCPLSADSTSEEGGGGAIRFRPIQPVGGGGGGGCRCCPERGEVLSAFGRFSQ